MDPSVGEIWTETLSALKLAMARGTFNSCLLGSRPLAFDGETLTVEARYDHAVPWLENRLAPVLAFYLPGVRIHSPCRTRTKSMKHPELRRFHCRPA
jgi:hypothetical protein